MDQSAPGTALPVQPTDPVSRIARILVAIALVVILVLLLQSLADVAVRVFAAALVACVLRGAAERLGRATRLSPGIALAAILLGLLLILVLAAWTRGPAIVAEIGRLTHQIAGQADQLQSRLAGIPWGRKLVARAEAYLNGLDNHVAGMIGGVATGTLGALGSVVVLLVSALYFAAAPDTYVDGTVLLLPKRHRARGRAVMSALGHTLRWWFLGQAVDMLVIGLLTGIGLFALGIPLWGTLATIAALFNFVPYIGALAGAVPAIGVALGQGTETALWVALLFGAVQTLEGNVVAPLIQRRTVELPPVLTILSQTVLGTLLGPLGLILATPMTAVGMVLVRMLYIEDVLGDRDRETDSKLRST